MTYSLTLRELVGPSGSITKGAKLSIPEVDGNFIYLQYLAASASAQNGVPVRDQDGNVIFDPINKLISNGYTTVLDFNSCFPFMPQELSIGSNLYVGGAWGSTTSDTQEAHKAISWDSVNYRNIFYGDGSQLSNLPQVPNSGYILITNSDDSITIGTTVSTVFGDINYDLDVYLSDPSVMPGQSVKVVRTDAFAEGAFRINGTIAGSITYYSLGHHSSVSFVSDGSSWWITAAYSG